MKAKTLSKVPENIFFENSGKFDSKACHSEKLKWKKQTIIKPPITM